jgi:pantoate--beta-alanine ligase
MKIFNTKQEIKRYLTAQKKENKTIGFVPTMGALHQGHLSLIKKAAKKNELIVVSIFVNPTQFDSNEDLIKYPKSIEIDTKLLESVSCDVLFIPSVEEIYENNISSEKFDFEGLEHQMEGKYREDHFNGVGTIVKTLFEIVTPNKAYFGQKDFQQLQIIKKMVKMHRLSVKIKGCRIFREEDGLAMSSRNIRLTKEHRAAAPFIYKTLKRVRENYRTENVTQLTDWVNNQFKKHPLLDLEYFTIAEEKTLETLKNNESNKKTRAFIAVFAGNIRLIDNIRLKND